MHGQPPLLDTGLIEWTEKQTDSHTRKHKAPSSLGIDELHIKMFNKVHFFFMTVKGIT